MAGLFHALKRGVKAAAASPDTKRYRAGGIAISCPHCQNDTFEKGAAQLNTAVATFLNLDWLNKSATILACLKCGRIQWFAGDVDRAP
ncbi:MAG: hypothetical protein AB1796_15515 [Bacillota bacterium]